MRDQRKQQLAAWSAETLGLETVSMAPVSGDASFRRYFRFRHGSESIIAVDAPPTHENNQAFYQIGQLLLAQGLMVPRFLKVNFEDGFLLISDLGDRLYLPELTQDNVDHYYHLAIDALLKIQFTPARAISALPHYDEAKLRTEMALFKDWFIDRHLQLQLNDTEKMAIEQVFGLLVHSALEQPQCLVHRDYHSRNLMICDAQTPGIIDFQDAVIGPASYDLVSLLKDCYIQWPVERVDQWLGYYHQRATQAGLLDSPVAEFRRQFDWMGMQRHIKVLGIFCRLNYRDGKPNYLDDLALTFDYLREAAKRYPEFTPFVALLDNKIAPAMEAKR